LGAAQVLAIWFSVSHDALFPSLSIHGLIDDDLKLLLSRRWSDNEGQTKRSSSHKDHFRLLSFVMIAFKPHGLLSFL